MFAPNPPLSNIARYARQVKSIALVCALSTLHCMGSTDCDARGNKQAQTNDAAIRLCKEKGGTVPAKKFYVQPSLAYSISNSLTGDFFDFTKKPSRNFSGSIACGLLYKQFGLEFEGSYYTIKASTVVQIFPELYKLNIDLDSTTVAALVNGYYVLPMKHVNLYAGVGAGGSFNSAKKTSTSSDELLPATVDKTSSYSFAYQGFVGLTRTFSDSFSVDLKLKFVNLTNIKFSPNVPFSVTHKGKAFTSSISLGGRYIF